MLFTSPPAPSNSDGLHLTKEGYAVLYDEVMDVIKNEFKDRGLGPEIEDGLPLTVPQ